MVRGNMDGNWRAWYSSGSSHHNMLDALYLDELERLECYSPKQRVD
jgi:hypothetical protein